MASRGKRGETVLICRIHMVQRIFPSAHIQGIAVGKERFAAQFFNHLYHNRRIIRAQICQISRLPKMDFDCRIFFREINLADTRRFYQTFQLLREVFVKRCPHICVIYF